MSDATASQTALDPERPWITNEEDLPVRMSWFQTFLNPAGETPKLDFTRGWTVLFFAGLLSWMGLLRVAVLAVALSLVIAMPLLLSSSVLLLLVFVRWRLS